MSETDRLVADATAYSRGGHHDGALPARPGRAVAVVTCMDCRIDPALLFGLGPGEAHVLRNAGGVITDDMIRSLAISQRFLGTREIVLVHHTRCGMQGLEDERLADELEAETGSRPPWAAGGFADPFDDVRRGVEALRIDPFIPDKSSIRGFVFDVEAGSLTEV